MTFEAEFKQFVESASKHFFGMNRQWFYSFENASVYLRIGPRYIDGRRVNVVTIATISMDEKFQKTGTFTRLVSTIQGLSSLPIYIENVMDSGFSAALRRRGFSVVQDTGYTTDLVLEHPGVPCPSSSSVSPKP